MLISTSSCTWDPGAGGFWRKELHSIPVRYPHLLPTALPVCLPGLGIYRVARHPLTTQSRREYLEKTQGLQCSHTGMHLCTQTPSPFTQILEHTTHPAPAVVPHPHASPGLGVLWTPSHKCLSQYLLTQPAHTSRQGRQHRHIS